MLFLKTTLNLLIAIFFLISEIPFGDGSSPLTNGISFSFFSKNLSSDTLSEVISSIGISILFWGLATNLIFFILIK